MSNVSQQPGASPDGLIYAFVTEPYLRRSAVAALRFEFGPSKVRGTDDRDVALSWLQDGHPAAFLIGYDVGAEFASRIRSVYPSVPLVLLGGDAGAAPGSGAQVGPTRLIPDTFSDVDIRDAMSRLLPGRSTPRLGDRDAAKPLVGLLQLLVRAGYMGALEVSAHGSDMTGRFWLRDGVVIDAAVGEERGLDAIEIMSHWRKHTFTWVDETPQRETIEIPARILAEKIRHRDRGAPRERLRDGRSGVQTDEFSTPFPRSPVQGAGDTETEVEVARHSETSSSTPTNPDASSALTTDSKGGHKMANNVKETLGNLSDVDGFIAAAIVDSDSGMSLGTLGGGDDFDIDVAAAVNTEVVQAKMRAVDKLELEDDIEDILISLGSQYHLIRPLDDRPNIFFYLALDRTKSNLAMARMSVSDAGNDIEL